MQLADLTGCDAQDLASTSIRHEGRSAFRLRDEIATTHSLQRAKIRVCPECVRHYAMTADECWRAPRHVAWKFVSVRSCPEHDCTLINLPSAKHSRNRQDFTAQLRKHWDFLQSAVPTAQPTTPFEIWLFNRIMGRRGTGLIDRLELNVASRACEMLGLLLDRGPNAKRTGRSEQDWAQFAQSGFDVLNDGEEALSDCLTELMSRENADRRFFSTVYGPFTDWLNGRGLGEEFEPLRDIVRQHIFQNFSVRKGILVLGKPSSGFDSEVNIAPTVSLGSLSAVMQEILVHRRLASKGSGEGLHAKGFVTEAMLVSLQREADNLIDVSEAAQLLNISMSVLEYLATNGILAPRLTIGPNDRLYDRDMLLFCLRNCDLKAALDQDAEYMRPMTATDVAAALKITQKTVFYLASSGFLGRAGRSEQARDGSLTLNPISVRAFEDKFISLGQLVQDTGLRQGALAINLRNTNVEMLAIPPDLSRIYWRQDVFARFGKEFADET